MANRIRELRNALSLTQSELAMQIGLNQSAVGKYERDELEPNLDTLRKLSAIFQCSIDYIVGNTDDFGNITVAKNPTSDLTSDAQELLEIYSSLDKMHRVQVLEYARYFAERTGISIPKKGA